MFGSFVKATTDQGVRQSATDSGGVLGSYRYFFTRHHGVEGNYGYSQNTQRYFLTSGTVGVKARSHEVSGAYVFRFPTRFVTPFALGGAGALIFAPKDSPSLDTQSRFSFVYGGGADFKVSSRFYVRAQFRESDLQVADVGDREPRRPGSRVPSRRAFGRNRIPLLEGLGIAQEPARHTR